MRGVSFLIVELHLEFLALIECDFGRGLVSDIGAVGAGCVCGSLEERWNNDLKGRNASHFCRSEMK